MNTIYSSHYTFNGLNNNNNKRVCQRVYAQACDNSYKTGYWRAKETD